MCVAMKKSRVKKYESLHQEIAADMESDVKNSDLSRFANRLNQIDDQFEKIHTNELKTESPVRARQHQNQANEFVDHSNDHYENEYLKDFLSEVKEYNVKKGYRDEDTRSNLISEIKKEMNADKELEVLDDDLETIVEELSFVEKNKLTSEEIQEELEKTKVYGQGIYDTQDLDLAEEMDAPQDEQTISLAVKELVDDLDDTSYDEHEFDDFEEPFADTDELEDRIAINQELLEQTQTLQHKIIDQEKTIDEMNDKMVRTNRLLNVVLSLILFAIIVVLLLFVKQFLNF